MLRFPCALPAVDMAGSTVPQLHSTISKAPQVRNISSNIDSALKDYTVIHQCWCGGCKSVANDSSLYLDAMGLWDHTADTIGGLDCHVVPEVGIKIGSKANMAKFK